MRSATWRYLNTGTTAKTIIATQARYRSARRNTTTHSDPQQHKHWHGAGRVQHGSPYSDTTAKTNTTTHVQQRSAETSIATNSDTQRHNAKTAITKREGRDDTFLPTFTFPIEMGR